MGGSGDRQGEKDLGSGRFRAFLGSQSRWAWFFYVREEWCWRVEVRNGILLDEPKRFVYLLWFFMRRQLREMGIEIREATKDSGYPFFSSIRKLYHLVTEEGLVETLC